MIEFRLTLQTFFSRWASQVANFNLVASSKSDRTKRVSKINSKRAKYRDKFKKIISNLIMIYTNNSNIKTDVDCLDQAQTVGVQWKYFKIWKIVFASQVRYEVNCQYGAQVIFNVIESRINLYESKFFISIQKLHTQKQMISQVKRDFKKKGRVILLCF